MGCRVGGPTRGQMSGALFLCAVNQPAISGTCGSSGSRREQVRVAFCSCPKTQNASCCFAACRRSLTTAPDAPQHRCLCVRAERPWAWDQIKTFTKEMEVPKEEHELPRQFVLSRVSCPRKVLSFPLKCSHTHTILVS